MSKNNKKTWFVIICVVMFMIIFSGCGQTENNELSSSKGSNNQEEVASYHSPKVEGLSGTTEDKDIAYDDSNGSNNVQGEIKVDTNRPESGNSEIDGLKRSNVDADSQEPENILIDWQELTANYNPPRIDDLLQAIKDSETSEDGSVVITPEIKREFNQMGEGYRFFFMPKVTWYNFKPIAYEGTGEALVYILFTWTGEFGTFPEKAPKYEVEARMRKIFAAPNNEYPQIIHKDYKKCVMFDGDTYTPWPESYNANTMIYNLTDLNVRQDGDFTYYHASANEYQFDLTGAFEPGENEIFLNNQAKALGLDNATTLLKLLETDKISFAPKSRHYTIEFRIEGDNTIPKIVSVDKEI